MSRLAHRHAADLDQHGWCTIGQALDPAILALLEADLAPVFAATPLCQGAFYGERTLRFGSLLARSPLAERLVMHPLVLGVVNRMLLPWCERIGLNLTQAIEIQPGALPQLPHRDQDMWQGPKGSIEYLVNVMWPLTPFTRENGGTRLWPGSHLDQQVPVLPEDEAIFPSVRAGDALRRTEGRRHPRRQRSASPAAGRRRGDKGDSICKAASPHPRTRRRLARRARLVE